MDLLKGAMMRTKPEATIEDLYQVPEKGKAEIVDGELVLMSPTGDVPSRAASNIYISLRRYESSSDNANYGRAYADNTGFIVNLPRRKSFSPDTAFYVGPRAGGKFLEGAPLFAVEVRSESDYGESAEHAMAAKRADYFAAGTWVVWDVDVLKDEVVRVYRARDPEHPQLYRRGEIAEAEPAVPRWTMPVEDLFA
jgi:Uma2 family endonuclease